MHEDIGYKELSGIESHVQGTNLIADRQDEPQGTDAEQLVESPSADPTIEGDSNDRNCQDERDEHEGVPTVRNVKVSRYCHQYDQDGKQAINQNQYAPRNSGPENEPPQRQLVVVARVACRPQPPWEGRRFVGGRSATWRSRFATTKGWREGRRFVCVRVIVLLVVAHDKYLCDVMVLHKEVVIQATRCGSFHHIAVAFGTGDTPLDKRATNSYQTHLCSHGIPDKCQSLDLAIGSTALPAAADLSRAWNRST
jgi:hypothetical protein